MVDISQSLLKYIQDNKCTAICALINLSSEVVKDESIQHKSVYAPKPISAVKQIYVSDK